MCEAYGRNKATAPLLQGLNKHLLGTLACLLAPLRLAALELSSQRRPTLQQVLPVYMRLEKLFTSKAGEAGTGTASKLCHFFLEALKENFKVPTRTDMLPSYLSRVNVDFCFQMIYYSLTLRLTMIFIS